MLCPPARATVGVTPPPTGIATLELQLIGHVRRIHPGVATIPLPAIFMVAIHAFAVRRIATWQRQRRGLRGQKTLAPQPQCDLAGLAPATYFHRMKIVRLPGTASAPGTLSASGAPPSLKHFPAHTNACAGNCQHGQFIQPHGPSPFLKKPEQDNGQTTETASHLRDQPCRKPCMPHMCHATHLQARLPAQARR